MEYVKDCSDVVKLPEGDEGISEVVVVVVFGVSASIVDGFSSRAAVALRPGA